MLAEPYQSLLQRLAGDIPQSRLITDPLRTLAYGTDASFYRLTPKVIVKVENESETLAVLKACRELRIAVTFRASGTSGATEKDFERFRRGIDKGRTQAIAKTSITNSATQKSN